MTQQNDNSKTSCVSISYCIPVDVNNTNFIIINRSLSVTLLFLCVSAKLFCFELSEAMMRGQD